MNYRLVPMDRSTVPDVAAIDAECFSKPWSEDMLCEELYNDNASYITAVADDGTGYPPQGLAALHEPEPGENAPHILGLHVVEQIAAAHGGQAVFGQAVPHGAKTTVWLPLHLEK